jgi:hypothetical protein
MTGLYYAQKILPHYVALIEELQDLRGGQKCFLTYLKTVIHLMAIGLETTSLITCDSKTTSNYTLTLRSHQILTQSKGFGSYCKRCLKRGGVNNCTFSNGGSLERLFRAVRTRYRRSRLGIGSESFLHACNTALMSPEYCLKEPVGDVIDIFQCQAISAWEHFNCHPLAVYHC